MGCGMARNIKLRVLQISQYYLILSQFRNENVTFILTYKAGIVISLLDSPKVSNTRDAMACPGSVDVWNTIASET